MQLPLYKFLEYYIINIIHGTNWMIAPDIENLRKQIWCDTIQLDEILDIQKF